MASPSRLGLGGAESWSRRRSQPESECPPASGRDSGSALFAAPAHTSSEGACYEGVLAPGALSGGVLCAVR